ncbi:MAG: DoxX family protein [Alphaproteobacteria bacterium]
MSEQKYFLPFLKPVYNFFSPLAFALLRITTGLFLMPHGAQKLFGALGGKGLAAEATAFAHLGIPMPHLVAAATGSVEFFGGLLIALGLFTRPAAFAATIVLFNAMAIVHLQHGFFAQKGGFEYAALWMIATLFFSVRGGGCLSVDRLIGREF